MEIADSDIVDLLHGAFVEGKDSEAANATLLGAIGAIGSTTDGDVLLLGAGDESNNDFYAVPMSFRKLRNGIYALITRRGRPQKPDETDQRLWDAMDEREQALHVSEEMRPQPVSPSRWNSMSWRERAASAMHRKTSGWDARGALSDMKPANVEIEDLAIVARVMSRLSQHEMEQLVRIGYHAGGPEVHP